MTCFFVARREGNCEYIFYLHLFFVGTNPNFWTLSSSVKQGEKLFGFVISAHVWHHGGFKVANAAARKLRIACLVHTSKQLCIHVVLGRREEPWLVGSVRPNFVTLSHTQARTSAPGTSANNLNHLITSIGHSVFPMNWIWTVNSSEWHVIPIGLAFLPKHIYTSCCGSVLSPARLFIHVEQWQWFQKVSPATSNAL